MLNADTLYNYYLYQVNQQFRRVLQYYYQNKINVGRKNHLDLLGVLIDNKNLGDKPYFWDNRTCVVESTSILKRYDLLLKFDYVYSKYWWLQIIQNACKNDMIEIIIHIEKFNIMNYDYLLQKAFLYGKENIIAYTIKRTKELEHDLNYTKAVLVAANAGQYHIVANYLDKCIVGEDFIQLAIKLVIDEEEEMLVNLLAPVKLSNKSYRSMIRSADRHNRTNISKILKTYL